MIVFCGKFKTLLSVSLKSIREYGRLVISNMEKTRIIVVLKDKV